MTMPASSSTRSGPEKDLGPERSGPIYLGLACIGFSTTRGGPALARDLEGPEHGHVMPREGANELVAARRRRHEADFSGGPSGQ